MGRQNSGKSISRRKLIGIAAAAIVMPSRLALARAKPCAATYHTSSAPPDAVLEVRLIDMSHADAPATTIAVTRVKTRHRLPVPYRLRFDDAQIKPGRSCALHARITVNGRLWFMSAARHAGFIRKTDETDIRVERVTSERPAASDPSGKWLAESIHGHGVIAQPAGAEKSPAAAAATGSPARLRSRASASASDR